VPDRFSERLLRFVRLRPELLPLEVWVDGAPLEPDWLGITHSLTPHEHRAVPLESFNLCYFRDDGELLYWQQFETLEIALDQAHAVVGVEREEWRACDIEIPEDERVPWSALR
jgi:hypothetical protein